MSPTGIDHEGRSRDAIMNLSPFTRLPIYATRCDKDAAYTISLLIQLFSVISKISLVMKDDRDVRILCLSDRTLPDG